MKKRSRHCHQLSLSTKHCLPSLMWSYGFCVVMRFPANSPLRSVNCRIISGTSILGSWGCVVFVRPHCASTIVFLAYLWMFLLSTCVRPSIEYSKEVDVFAFSTFSSLFSGCSHTLIKFIRVWCSFAVATSALSVRETRQEDYSLRAVKTHLHPYILFFYFMHSQKLQCGYERLCAMWPKSPVAESQDYIVSALALCFLNEM